MAKILSANDEQNTRHWCAVPEAYPDPRVEQSNPYYAMLLLEDYAGAVSEFTAISQYFHHYLALTGDYDDVADLEECISITEMHHLRLLGETIKLLGAAPKLRTLTNNRTTYWDASYVYYGTDICDRLAADIAAEKTAIRQYRQHQKMIEDPYIQELLERIIKDEEQHLHLFRQAAAKYCQGIVK